MRKLNLIAIFSLILVLMACTKEDTLVALPDGSISFNQPAGTDVIEMPVSILLDGTTVLEMKAALTGNTSTNDHYVTFAVDTTKIVNYKAKYGAATLLPTSSYLFYKPISVLRAGATESEAAQLNIGQQTKLTELTTYVLPVVIKSVDGKTEGTASSRVVYYVLKTGKGFVSRTGWTIAGQSSVNGTFVAANVIDVNNTTTYWTSNLTQTMPQWVSINFNKEVTFSGLNYYLPTALAYPKNGGYPTSVQIETSMDGTAWVSKGVFAGNITPDGIQRIDLGGTTTARYLRFTVLACVKYVSGVNQYDAIFISGILLAP